MKKQHGTIRIEAKEVWVHGGKMIKVIGLKGVLSRKDLPAKYINSDPHITLSPSKTYISVCTDEGIQHLAIGGRKTPETFDNIIDIIRISGSRLAEIKKEMVESWGRKFTVKI